MDARKMGAIQLVAQLIATVTDPHDVGVGGADFGGTELGASCVLVMPSGDRYRVSVEWVGDRETEEVS